MSGNPTERDFQFLEHEILLFRGAFSERGREFLGGSADGAKKMFSRLKEYVVSYPFVGSKKFYAPSAKTAKRFGAPEEIAKIGEQALPTVIGIAGFCHQGQTPRPRYTRPALKEDFPEDLIEEHLGNDYYSPFYLDKDGERVRLGFIAVDLGGDCQRFLAKWSGRIHQWRRKGSLVDVIRSGQFALAIVVPNEAKKQAFEDLLREKPLPVFVRVEAVSELAEWLLGGKR